jgi:hypothetical protein
VRGHAGEPTHVLVLATLGASERRLLARRRARPAPPGPSPAPVATARATLIAAQPFVDAGDAERWMREAAGEHEAAAAIADLNRVLHLHRCATADPSVREVAREHALVGRIGIGDGDRVADGRWTAAVELAPLRPQGRRRGLHRSQERLAALLAGRDAALACEELALRARADVTAGRHREAALQLRIALDAALSELEPWSGRADLERRLEELRAMRPAAEAAADSALLGGLGEIEAADVERVLGRLEAALRARTAAGFD